MIALICSVPVEADLLLQRLEHVRTTAFGSKTAAEGQLTGRSVVLCAGGMGKVNAAHAAAVLIERHAPEAVMVFGIGGAYPSSGARVGDIAFAREEVAGDEGVLTGEGFRDTRFIGIPLLTDGSRDIYNTFAVPLPLVDRGLRSLQERARPDQAGVHAGTFVTLSTASGTRARARELEQRYHGLCENMEGAAVAQVASAHRIPWLEVRGISNIVEDRDPSQWDIPRAALAAQQAVLQILGGWRR